jgi:hypothetical protein
MYISNNYKDVLTRLKFLGKIQPGEKINTKSCLSIVNNDWVTSIMRTFYTFDSRKNTLIFINDTMTSTFQLIEQLEHERDPMKSLDVLYKTLAECINGIKNLRQTYQKDKITVCQLETIIENIELFLNLRDYRRVAIAGSSAAIAIHPPQPPQQPQQSTPMSSPMTTLPASL